MESVTSETPIRNNRLAFRERLSDFGKSRCWNCGERDIWKRHCGKCSAKFCASCLMPGPVLTECCLCEKILRRRDELQNKRDSLFHRIYTTLSSHSTSRNNNNSMMKSPSTNNRLSLQRRVCDDEINTALGGCPSRPLTTVPKSVERKRDSAVDRGL